MNNINLIVGVVKKYKQKNLFMIFRHALSYQLTLKSSTDAVTLKTVSSVNLGYEETSCFASRLVSVDVFSSLVFFFRTHSLFMKIYWNNNYLLYKQIFALKGIRVLCTKTSTV